MFEFIVIVLLLLAGTNWLLTALAKRPGSGRVLMGGCGLCLAVYMTITGLCMLAEPELDTGFGVVILVKAVKGR